LWFDGQYARKDIMNESQSAMFYERAEPHGSDCEMIASSHARRPNRPVAKAEEPSADAPTLIRKDLALVALAERGNVAQFVSFTPDNGVLRPKFSRIKGLEPDYPFADLGSALACLLSRSPAGSINLRSYAPDSPRSRTFVYGLKNLDAALEAAADLIKEGLHVIANETVDINDGGVSGVIMGDLIEFAPDDTPRCVEKPGVASLPLDLGRSILTTVYGFEPAVDARGGRLEFSVHPARCGWRKSHTLTWEFEATDTSDLKPKLVWPNRFSRMIGDKAFGLLMADRIGLPVPWTTVIGRRIAPFSFGRRTGETEVWIRTCPYEPDPGRYSTFKGWRDPFKLMGDEDPDGDRIASVLRQDAVPALFSGAAIVAADGNLVMEGLAGEGDLFMLGERRSEKLPNHVCEAVNDTYAAAARELGPVRFEWVFDGSVVWIVQMHLGATVSLPDALVTGEADDWFELDARVPLTELRQIVSQLPNRTGLRFVGEVNSTSHIADFLRKAGVPTRIAPHRKE
jgi:hypothetical protein